jgi:hypothetical protein
MGIDQLNMQVTSLKSLVSEYASRANQAEQLASKLMQGIDQVKAVEIGGMISRHMDIRSKERAIHQQAVLQATLMALTSTLNMECAEARTVVNTVIGNLTMVLGSMTETQRGNNPNIEQTTTNSQE